MAIVGSATESGGRLPKVKTILEPDGVRSSVALTSVLLDSGPGLGSVHAAADGLAGLDVGGGLGVADGRVVGVAVGWGLADAEGSAEALPDPTHAAITSVMPSPSASGRRFGRLFMIRGRFRIGPGYG
jgi:hypothetical protein